MLFEPPSARGRFSGADLELVKELRSMADFWKEMKEAYHEEYAKQEDERKKDTRPTEEKVLDGVADGLADAIITPVRRLFRLF